MPTLEDLLERIEDLEAQLQALRNRVENGDADTDRRLDLIEQQLVKPKRQRREKPPAVVLTTTHKRPFKR